MTGGSDVGTYTLIPGGPGVTTSPFGSFLYDNVITASANPALDVDGLLFGVAGKELNVWGNSADNYSFYDSTCYRRLRYAIDRNWRLHLPDRSRRRAELPVEICF